jgi:hypothetical protein
MHIASHKTVHGSSPDADLPSVLKSFRRRMAPPIRSTDSVLWTGRNKAIHVMQGIFAGAGEKGTDCYWLSVKESDWIYTSSSV